METKLIRPADLLPGHVVVDSFGLLHIVATVDPDGDKVVAKFISGKELTFEADDDIKVPVDEARGRRIAERLPEDPFEGLPT